MSLRSHVRRGVGTTHAVWTLATHQQVGPAGQSIGASSVEALARWCWNLSLGVHGLTAQSAQCGPLLVRRLAVWWVPALPLALLSLAAS